MPLEDIGTEKRDRELCPEARHPNTVPRKILTTLLHLVVELFSCPGEPPFHPVQSAELGSDGPSPGEWLFWAAGQMPGWGPALNVSTLGQTPPP